MDTFVKIVTQINDYVWSTPLVVLCLGAGIFFTILTRGGQFRLFKDMIRLIRAKSEAEKESEGSGKGISAFQSFATTVGSRVGMGNIAGVATALFFGGPGAIFWMWLIALIGAASSFAECTLAQAYKDKVGNEYMGGAQLFITKGLKVKPVAKVMAFLFAIAAVLGPGTLMPGLQIYQIASTFKSAFNTPEMVVGVVCVIAIAFVVWGGIKRIGQVAELLAPVMCVIYIVMAIVIIGMNITELPGVLGSIVSSAFAANSMFAGIIGAAISHGVKRGVYSNEAGQGSGAIVPAAAECSHPAKQGLVQALSVYIDTIVICTASTMIIMVTGNYNVVDKTGEYIVNNTASEYGALWAQDAVNHSLGSWGGKLLAIMIALFVFTSLMGYYYQAESNMKFIFKGKPVGTYLMRAIFLIAVFSGVIVDGQTIWSMADLGVGLMAWVNIIGILILSKKVRAILSDYEKQKKAGVDPLFDPAKFGIKDETGAWDKYAALLKKRESGKK
ncbi:MAG: alanine/glycine:cation symporter family protein [Eubacteriales bacterium]|nr:alanine/glycine:cation symporter family protein [Eubacteriales bacterium]